MRIAFVSVEAPPDSLYGGIGTYVGQIASALAARGNDVEVFTASPHPSDSITFNGYVTHRIHNPMTFAGRLTFSDDAAVCFAERHAAKPFDVLEGAEFLAEARGARRLVPSVPLVVKLHMSMTLIRQLNRPPLTPLEHVKEGFKSILQPALQLQRWKEFDYSALELPHLLEADVITAPCRGIADITAKMWNLDRTQIIEVPNPLSPLPGLLAIPVETQTGTIGYVGRLEQRKGVLDLAAAIPEILKRFPQTRFLLAGATVSSPVEGLTMEAYLARQLAAHKDRITFLGRVAPEKMPEVFAQMDICVLPSLWENFPNACLEAMSAGRGVVGSSAGGMAQQLDDGKAGLLIRPGQPKEIADSVCRLLANPTLRMDFGRKARARVLSEYNADRIGLLTEQSYERAIHQHRAGGRKWSI